MSNKFFPLFLIVIGSCVMHFVVVICDPFRIFASSAVRKETFFCLSFYAFSILAILIIARTRRIPHPVNYILTPFIGAFVAAILTIKFHHAREFIFLDITTLVIMPYFFYCIWLFTLMLFFSSFIGKTVKLLHKRPEFANSFLFQK